MSASSGAVQGSPHGIGFLVRHVHKAFARVLAERLGPYGVTSAQWTVLRSLWQEDCCSQVDLAANIRVEKASLTQILSSLERQGLIVRERSDTDRRRWLVSLTDQGRALEPLLLPFAGEIDRLASTGFSKKELAELKSLLTRALHHLES
ncbi:MarR family winged helix-turn-helix transcriptional regulator [Pigmentiphaga kullae]|uniref:DNA-binding MarR family transcriptional regulator n=1 Tax=Pigmentiphaga kullae TaxID=151784 RepID=A0A4Q7NHC2_9BURK|nr:MarR family transcriptional regulator [Pigmentiphaga kullae]RZS84256.1 DNA-binding MarR family transcriptional regulator [Pigmentiphaga kullae]